MLKYLKKYWFYVLLAPLFMLGEAGMDLLQPKLMATIVDEGVLGVSNGGVGDLQIVIGVGIRMILLIFLGAVCGVLSGVFANLAAQNFANDVRKDAFDHIMHFSFAQTDRFTTGSLITRVTNDVTQIQNMIQMAIRGYVRTMILLVGGVIFMMELHLSFGRVVLCAMPFILLIMIGFLSRVTPKFGLLQERLDDVNNVVQENVAGNRVVKAYVQEEREKKRFGEANGRLVDTQLSILLLLNYMTPLMNIVLNMAVIAVIRVGSIQAGKMEVSPGNIMAAITYLSQILNALMRLGMMFQNVSRGMASSKRLKEVIDTVPEICDGVGYEEKAKELKASLPEKRGRVEFRDVSFAYEGRNSVLDHCSVKIEAGETVGILGMTGSGKTTLVNLIPRFYDVTGGEVLVDGVDVRDYKLEDLRSRIAYSMQKSELFLASIEENISWGKVGATKEELIDAATIAQAMEFIETKENGMKEEVSQSGHSLSGGQKQRVAIARAVVKEAEILIFDDSTSALDLRTESNLYHALKERYPERTKIIIAQRVASVKDADRILVLDEGCIAASGTHEELLESSPIYKDIYDSQMGGDD